jgi:two-component system, OmpR family, response regulator
MDEKKRILIVDDEAGFTRLLKLTLERTGEYTVQEENDGTKAHETARRFKPDLILLDIVMPKIDGGDVASQLRADPMMRRTPIVFLTAIVSKQETQSGGLIGGFPFIAKPVSLEGLIKCIKDNLAAPTA